MALNGKAVDTIFVPAYSNEEACKTAFFSRRSIYGNHEDGEYELFGSYMQVNRQIRCKTVESSRSKALVDEIITLCEAGTKSILIDGYESVMPAYSWDRKKPYFTFRQHMVSRKNRQLCDGELFNPKIRRSLRACCTTKRRASR